MKRKIHLPKGLSNLSGSRQDGDGVDPRYDRRGYEKCKGTAVRKASQLCSQVRRALDYIIPDELQDDELDAVVVDVQPAPNTGSLLVLLQPIAVLDQCQLRRLEELLNQKSGVIRTAVAQAIHRRKAPTLAFRIIPLGGQ